MRTFVDEVEAVLRCPSSQALEKSSQWSQTRPADDELLVAVRSKHLVRSLDSASLIMAVNSADLLWQST